MSKSNQPSSNKTIHENLQYHAALGFYKNGISQAKNITKEKGNKIFEIAPAAAVNLSFAAELLLKLIYHLDTQKRIHAHELNKIFSCLDVSRRREIENKYNQYKLNTSKEFRSIKLSFNTNVNNPEDRKNINDITNMSLIEFLKLHSNGFVKWRYVYEIEDKYYSYEFNFNLMNEFIKALLHTVDEIRAIND